MLNTKVIKFLRALSKSELLRFRSYLQSPYWEVKDHTLAFFEVLYQCYPFDLDELSKEKLWDMMFPEEPIDEQKIYFLSSYLFKHLLNFLALEQLGESPADHLRIELINSLDSRDLERYIPRIIQEAQKRQDKGSFWDDQYYLEQFRLAQLSSNYQLQQNNRKQSTSYNEVLSFLDVFYLINRFRYALALTNQLRVLQGNENPELIQSVQEQYKDGNFEHIPILRMQYTCMEMLQSEKNDSSFEQLMQGLKDHQDQISANDAYELYSLGLNYCSRRYRQGEMVFLRHMFEIYSEMSEREILFYGSAPRIHIFKNLITLGLKLKEYTWIQAMIERYGDHLPEKSREGVVAYSQALLHFTRGNFGKAQKQLINVQFIDPFYRLSYDLLLLKIYYELGDFEPLIARIRAFSVYIERNKSLSSDVKFAYQNMGRLLRKLARYKFDNKGQLEKIKATMEAFKLLVERNWFEEKLNEL